jgi:endonuclease/exonuclease/phosphatase (EEP) superfamily protein YafD
VVTPADERRFYRFLIRTAFVIVSAASLLALLSEQFWVAELFSHFRLYYLLIQALLVLIFLSSGHHKLMAMTLFMALPNAWVVGPYLVSEMASMGDVRATRDMGTGINMVVLNVHYQNDGYAQVADYLRDRDPDVIVISEYTPAWQAALEFLRESHANVLAESRSGHWGIAVYSRLPFNDAELIALAKTDAVHARFVIEVGGMPLEVFAVHLYSPTSSAKARHRNLQLEDLADRLKASEHRRLVVGDMNLTPYSPYFDRFTERSGLQDARLVDGIHITWPASALPIWIPIDHALADPAANVAWVRTGPDIGSDHFPLEIFLSDRVSTPGGHDKTEYE